MTETSTQAAPAPLQVRVKELIWREWQGAFYGSAPYMMGYSIRRDDGRWTLDGTVGYFDSLDAAKAKAQADYDQRILSALDLSTPTQIAALEAAPVAFVSAGQFAALPADPADEGGAAYLPARHGAAGQFQMPLYAAASVAALEAENVKLRAERDALQSSVWTLEAKVDALAPHGTCACSWDEPNDLCAHHSPKLAAAGAEVARLTEALKPFARNACRGDGNGELEVPNGHAARFHDLNSQTKPTLVEGDFRRARDTLAALKGSTDAQA